MGKKETKEIGLALGGGAVLGAAHIGVIRAIEEFKIPIKYIAGTSIGAMVAALYAFGKNWQEIREISQNLNWFDLSGISISKYGLLSNKKVGKMISEHLGDVIFQDSKIPLAIITTDIATGEKVVLKEGNIADAVMASTCIPGIFEPIEKGDQLLVDGGIMENVPAITLYDMGANYSICVDLNVNNSIIKPANIIELMINTVHITLRNVTRLQTRKASVLISPDLTEFNYYDLKQIPDLMEKGYQESKKALERQTDLTKL
jgi:NTE family protein